VANDCHSQPLLIQNHAGNMIKMRQLILRSQEHSGETWKLSIQRPISTADRSSELAI
jgi:hypothetical protein